MKNSSLTDGERLKLLRELYNLVFEASESFEDEDIGSDLAYLMGAIVCGHRCTWPSNRPIVKLLSRSPLPAATQAMAFVEKFKPKD